MSQIPGWSVVFPEPKSFTGAPDETGVDRRTGPREEPDAPQLSVLTCHACGKPVVDVYSLAGVGVFCSAQCRETWQRQFLAGEL